MERDDGSERCTARWMQKVYREWQIDDYWLWKLWNMQVPPKVKNFCWQLASQFLPTRDALNSKHVACALQCNMCHNHDETALHLFANYRETTIMWNSLGLPINQHCNDNISDWFFLNISSLKEDCLCKFAMACWGLWCSRNDSVWKGVPYEMHAMLYAAMSLWSNWKLVNGVDDPCENDSAGKKKEVIGRLVTLNPTKRERYYLRFLLMNVRTPKSFDHIKTTSGHQVVTFREAAENLGILSGDHIVMMKCLDEAVSYQTSRKWIALAIASSGIAASILPGGRIASMANHRAIESIDTTLRDIMDTD
nr:putative ribonuclease H-like domain, reverse transcriptase zinc-binding domain-containing protein [Ipomoea batatas]